MPFKLKLRDRFYLKTIANPVAVPDRVAIRPSV